MFIGKLVEFVFIYQVFIIFIKYVVLFEDSYVWQFFSNMKVSSLCVFMCNIFYIVSKVNYFVVLVQCIQCNILLEVFSFDWYYVYLEFYVIVVYFIGIKNFGSIVGSCRGRNREYLVFCSLVIVSDINVELVIEYVQIKIKFIFRSKFWAKIWIILFVWYCIVRVVYIVRYLWREYVCQVVRVSIQIYLSVVCLYFCE